MTDSFGDARIEELKLLAEIDRYVGGLTLKPAEGAQREMVEFLVHERFVTAFESQWSRVGNRVWEAPGLTDVEVHLRECWAKGLSDVLEGRVSVHLKLTHKGRVRLSELKQAMTSEKLREPFGILWDSRHLETDLQIAILDAGENSPLSLGYLDMNGLKPINDGLGHDAGDRAMRAYFTAVAMALADRCTAYRVGGDEVIAILPSHGTPDARSRLRKACWLLMKENLGPLIPHVSLAVGVLTTTDPRMDFRVLRAQAEEAMRRAKLKCRESAPRPSAIAELTGEVMLIPFENSEE